MRARSLVHLSDGVLVSELKALLGRERSATAAVVAHMAEVDARKLYLPAGYPSMYAYCVEELSMSEDAAYRRITSARAARKFPALIEALADGRLHLSAVGLLAPHLTRENAEGLIRGAANKCKREVELFLAQRFPRSEHLPMVQAIPAAPGCRQLVPGRVQSETAQVSSGSVSGGPMDHDPLADTRSPGNQLVPGRVQATRSRATPIAPERFALQVTISKAIHDKLQHAQALLSHRIPGGDLAQVLERVLDLAIEQLEKQKFAKTSKPRPRRKGSGTSTRHVPAHVKRAVWERDQGRCTFVSASGRRCDSRTLLEFDHVTPVAKGGTATIEGMRLRCRGHNQHEAEQAFGAGFMDEKRARARCALRPDG